MNKKALNSAFTGLIKRLEKTENFIVDQAPEICKQMIYEKKLEQNISVSINGTLAVVTPIVTTVLAINSHGQYTESHEGLSIIFGAASIIIGIWAICIFDDLRKNIEWLIFLKKCPKLFLLREFRNLIKE